jgi:hypothetical protein
MDDDCVANAPCLRNRVTLLSLNGPYFSGSHDLNLVQSSGHEQILPKISH